MKRILAAIVLLVVGVWVVRDLTSATSMVVDISKQDKAIGLFESRHGDMTRDEEKGYLDNAYQACAYLDDNPDLPALWMAMTDSRISGDAAATTIEAAVTYLCTEHKGLLL